MDRTRLSVALPPDMLRIVHETVEAGEYASTEEALCDAVRVWQRQRHESEARLDAIRIRIQRSMDDPRPSLSEAELQARLRLLTGDAAA